MIWIMLPAFNEEKSLPSLIKKIYTLKKNKNYKIKILIIDDGSTDNTIKIAHKLVKKNDLIIVSHDINRGLGETERDGFEYIVNNANDEDFVVRMDCDDTHEPSYIPHLLNEIQKGYDVVNTSRFAKGGKQIGVSF